MRKQLLFLTLVFSAFASHTYAACSGTLTSMQVIDPPTQNFAQVQVGYAFTETDGFILLTRRDDVTGQEQFIASGNRSGSGSFGGSVPFECIVPQRSYTYIAALTANCTPQIHAQRTETRTYDPQPTVQASIVAMNDEKTSATVSVDYTFPYVSQNASPGRRRIQAHIDGVFAGETTLQPGEPVEGTKEITLSFLCLGSGPHEISFSATYTPQGIPSLVCWSSPPDEPDTFNVQQAEITSFTIEPFDDHGTLLATVGYRFESTPSDSRSVILTFGTSTYGIPVTGNEGTGSVLMERSCLPPGTYTVTAKATACRRFDDPRFTDVRDFTFGVPFAKGTVTLAGSYDPVGEIHLSAGYEVPPGVSEATLVITRRIYVGDNGLPVVPIEIDRRQVSGSGTFTKTDIPSQLAREIPYDATLFFCGSKVHAATSVQCPGCPYPPTATGDPVSFDDANMRYSDRDPLPPLLGSMQLTRNYDSHQRIRGVFGLGWTSMFDRRLFVHSEPDGEIITLTDDSESAMFLHRGNAYTQLWPRGQTAAGTLSLEQATSLYVYRSHGSMTACLYRSADGRFAGYRQLGTGREMRIQYDASGLPQSVQDNWTGVTWTVTVDAATKRVTSIEIGGLTWQYQYVSDRLTAVLAPGSAQWRSYEYSADRLTASRDAAGNLIESHSYDSTGRAISSTGPEDEIQSIEYNAAGTSATQHVTRVTMKTGAVMEYILQPFGGSWRTVKITGGCGSCGTRDGVYAYDAEGHLTREQNASGYITERLYAASRIASTREHLRPANCEPSVPQSVCLMSPAALATAALTTTAATITTSYEYRDSLWPDKPTTIIRASISGREEPRREELAYHPSTGEVVIHAVAGRTSSTMLYGDVQSGDDGNSSNPHAPAFDPGGTFQAAWLSLPQPRLRKSTDGPRTDVADITSFVYYPVDPAVPVNLRGRLAAVRNAAGHMTRYESYDLFGNATRIVDPNGVATELTFDGIGRLLTSTVKGIAGCDTTQDPLCATDLTSVRTYSPPAGPLRSEQRPGGGVTVYEYDTRGRLQTVSRGPSANDLRERIQTSYDALTGKKSAEQRQAHEGLTWVTKTTESYSYDSLAQLQTMTHADTTSISYAYDSEGRLASVRDENHTTPNTKYKYDPAGRIAEVEQKLSTAAGGLIYTRYGYDPDGNLIAVTDPNGNVTTYTYDDLGQMIAQESPVTGTTRYQYDEAGNLIRSMDANQMMTERSYDALNRIIRATSGKWSDPLPPPDPREDDPPPPPPADPTVETVQWTYDDSTFAIGRLSSMTDPVGVTTYAYERRGMLARELRTLRSCLVTRDEGAQCTSSRTDLTTYQYDRDGNRNRIGYPSGGLTVQYQFDYAGRPTSAAGFIISASYLPFGPLMTLQFANGTTETFGYDERYRMIDNELAFTGIPGSNGRIAGYQYGYDNAGNVIKQQEKQDQGADYLRRFTYDDLNRLLTANTKPDSPNNVSPLWGKGEYTWDAMGNLLRASLAEVEPGSDDGELLAATNPKRFRPPDKPRKKDANKVIVQPLGRVQEFIYDATTPRMTAVSLNDLSHTVAHDAAGNELSYVATRTYSPRNLLQEVTDSIDPGAEFIHRLAYGYDGRGVRVVRTESPSNGSGTSARRSYVYSPELQLLSVTRNDAVNVWDGPEADPNPSLGNNVQYEIVWFGTRPVAQIAPGAPPLYTFADHLGTPWLQTDSTGTIQWRVEYEPFGSVYEVRVGTRTTQPLRFPGQEFAMSWEGPEENFNVYRWYKSGWGRYTQGDPIRTGLFLQMNSSMPIYIQRASVSRSIRPRSNVILPDWYSYVGSSPIGHTDRLGLMQDCDQLQLDCFKKCWNSCPPWPFKKGNAGHYKYCQTKCLAEYMECVAENELEELADKAKKWFSDPPTLPLIPILPPKAVPAPKPAIPGLPPFFINPCILKPSLCVDGMGGVA